MRLDEVISALTKMWKGMLTVDGMYTADGAAQRIRYINILKDYMYAEDPAGFMACTQRTLGGRDGDMMVDILEELFAELDVPGRDINSFERAYLI